MSHSDHPFQERVRHLYSNSKMSDFNFIVGPTQSAVPGHKFLFAIVSDVFYKSLYEDDSDEIQVPDMSYFTFMEFLKYVYFNELHLTQKIITDILKLSTDYQMIELHKRCIRYLRDNLYISNALFVLELCVKYDLMDLRDRCLSVIGNEPAKIFRDHEFLNLEENMLIMVLKSNHYVCPEYDIFMAAYAWAKTYCENHNMELTPEAIRSVMAKVWECIRFNKMPMSDFRKCLELKNLFTTEEIQRIFPIMKSRDTKLPRRETACSTKSYNRFKKVTREILFNDYKNVPEMFFEVSEPIYCFGFGVYGPTLNGVQVIKKQNVTATLQNDNCSVIKIKTIHFEFDGSDQIYEIYFEKPLPLSAREMYNVMIEYDELDLEIFESFIGTDGKEREEIDGIEVKYGCAAKEFGISSNFSQLAVVFLKKFLD